LRLYENKRQKSAAGFQWKQENTIVISTPEENFYRVQIQDRIVVVYTSEMSVFASEVALRKIPFCFNCLEKSEQEGSWS
jgi:hypothetical protein